MRSILFALLVCMSFSSFAQGKFAGVAIDGASNTGKIFRFKTDGTEVTIDKAFPNFPDGVNVVSGIFTKGPDGDLYGLTSNGGANGSGTLFKISLSEEMFVKVFDFPLAPYHGTPFGSLVAAPNGYLYGYLSRITVNAPYKSLIFRIKPDGTNYSIITEVDVIPDAPGESGLAYSASGFLYGTTFTSGASSIGSLFRIDLDGNLEVLTSFDATTGRYPVGRLIAVGGKIYGATQSSGNNKPTLFSVNENGTGLTTIHEFPSLSINSFTGLIKGPDDALYGVTTNGLTDIFRYGLDGSGYSKVFSIGHGIGKYLSFGSNNRIYGHNGASMIFSVNATGGDYTQHAVLDDWNSSNLAGLYVTTDGMVYGNGAGGNGNVGIFYKVNGNVPRNSQDAKLIKDLYSDTQGKKPLGHLTQLDDGDLLGATRMGGWNNRGTLFKIGPDGQNYRTIFDFGDVEINGYPADAPIKGPGGSYYQSTSAGDIFKINEDGTGFKRLYKANQVLFPLNDVGLLAASDGNLYGVSLNNDMPNGFLFRFNPASAGIEVIYTFNTSSIYYPQSRLIEGTDGFLYGTCFEGSTLGGVYKIKPDGSNFTVLKTFVNGLLGRSPIGDIFFGSNGKLYGYCFATTSNRQGLVFSIDADGSNYTIVHEFDPVSDRGAAIPTINGWGLITEGPGNLIYGFEPRGGTTGTGTAFNMNLDGTSYTKMELALNDHSIPLSIALGGIIFIPDKQKQTITFAELAPIENISNGHALTATASSSLAVTYTSSNTAVATISGSTVNAISEGLTVITAHQPGNGSYFAAHDVSRQLRVGKLTATAQLSSTTRGTVGGTIELTNNFDGPPELITYGVTNGTGSATLNGNVLSLTSAGTISVTIQLSGNDVYHPYSVSKEIKISKKTINPLVTSLSNGIDGSSITLQADADGSSGVITWSVQNKTGAASLADGKLNLEAAGAVIVKAEIAADDMHASGSVSQVISINSSLPDQPQIYGTMNRGGTGGEGVIYSINTDATGYRVLKDFLPSPTGAGVNQGLVTTGNGKYYGVTTYGGSENLGVIFEFDLEQNAYEVVYNFVEVGNNAHLMAGSDGMLYGVSTDGNLVILKFDPTTRVMTKIAATGMITSFFSELTEYSPGVFYGYAAMPNTKAGIYEFNSNTNTVTIRYQAGLGLDIGSGLDRLIKAPNGKMYASARSYLSFKGGIFEFDPATNGGSMKVVLNEATIGYSFSNITLKDDGNFIGVVNFNNENYLFEYVPGASTIISKFWLSDFGVDPSNTFVKASSGLLYTATNENVQKVVEYNPISNTVREVYQLESQRIQNRFSPLADGSLIGNTTSETTAGSLFHLDPQTAVFNELFEFSMPPEAIRPEGFDVDVNGKLYGVADRVETTNGNVVIEYDVATGAYRHFQMPADHYLDPSSIQLNSEGNLYGIAYTSSPELMEINLTTGEVSTMSPLDYFQEGSSLTFLTVTKDGRVFGTAEQLSAEEHAFIYEVDVTTGEMTVKKEYPGDGLFTKFVEGPDGKLYSYLFWNSDNTVVRYDVDLNEFETLGSFTGQLVGANIIPPYLSPEGKIYGMTRTGGNFNRGVLFEYDVAGNVFTNRYHFNETHTTTFGAPFVNVKDNKMFGTVSANGTGVNGYFFILDLTTNAFTTVSATPPTGRRPTGNLVKGKGAQVITFNAVENTPANSQPFQLQATSTSGLTVVYTSSNNAVAEINGNTVTIKGVGATTITASQPGNNDFYPAAPVERTLTVTKGTQTITFAEISTKTLGDAPFAITASSSSNLPISFSTTSSDKITGTPPSQIVLVKAGKATITAAQPGNENYEAAAPVDRTFCINPRKPTITVDGAKLTSSNDTGNQWYLNGTAINNATAPSFGATETGSYTVKTTVEGCASALSDAVTYTGVKDELLDLVEIYPNPTSQELFVTVPSSAVIIINDVLGRPIHQRQVVISKTEKFDVSEQPKGIYFVRIEMNENSLIRKVLIY